MKNFKFIILMGIFLVPVFLLAENRFNKTFNYASLKTITIPEGTYKVTTDIPEIFYGSYPAAFQSGELVLNRDGTGSSWLDSKEYFGSFEWGAVVDPNGKYRIGKRRWGTGEVDTLLIIIKFTSGHKTFKNGFGEYGALYPLYSPQGDAYINKFFEPHK